MNIHEMRMGQALFEQHVPKLIHALDTIGAALFSYIYREMVLFRLYDGCDRRSGRCNSAIAEGSRWYRNQDDLSASELEARFVSLFLI